MRCLQCNRDGISASAESCPHCGAYFPSLFRDLLPSGTTLNNGTYRIDYALGRGGFGVTYRAMHTLLEQVVAVKEFYPQEHAMRDAARALTVPAPKREPYQRALQRFIKEGRILARLSHPNVVRVHNLFEERGTAYIVMELIKGPTLNDELEAQPGRKLTPTRAQEIMEQLVGALEEVHKADIYHLDIKPDNVLISSEGRVVLVDFGASRQGVSRNSTQARTVDYAPPELLAGNEDVGPQSDIFELGMLLHEMLTGKLPPTSLQRSLRDAWNANALEEPWKSLLASGLRLHKEDRPNNVREWWKAASTKPKEPIVITLPAKPEKPVVTLPTFEFDTVKVNANGQIIERKKGRASYYTEDLGNGATMDFVVIPSGTFTMGSPANEADRYDSEGPQHQVTLLPFFMGKYQVTQAQWRTAAKLPKAKSDLNPDPSNFKGDNLPVEQVSWEDAMEFCARLQQKTGRAYRLPSEAEWEYACRAGTTTPFSFGETITPEIVNYNSNYPYGSAPKKGTNRQKTTPVGSLNAANGFGLYDMHGNVYEWCADAWHENYNGAPADGSVRETGGDQSLRVLRGGSWNNYGDNCRSALRYRYVPGYRYNYFGFRVVVSGARTLP